MGLSIHYSGRLKSASILPQLVEEVEDISRIMDWKCNVFNTSYPNDTFISPDDKQDYGIVFTPKDAESIILVFDSEGRLCNPWLREMFNKNPEKEIKIITVELNLNDENPEPVISEGKDAFEPKDLIYQISVKTQADSVEEHIKLMELLRYLSEKYLIEFTVYDESDYWETRDPEKLAKKMNRINELMGDFHHMLQNKSFENQEDFVEFLKKLGKMIHKNKDKE